MSRAAMTLWSISHTTLDAALGFRVASFIFIFCRVFLLKQTWRNFSWGAWVLAETRNNLNVEAGLNIRLGRRHWGFFWRQVVLHSSHIKHWSTDRCNSSTTSWDHSTFLRTYFSRRMFCINYNIILILISSPCITISRSSLTESLRLHALETWNYNLSAKMFLNATTELLISLVC